MTLRLVDFSLARTLSPLRIVDFQLDAATPPTHALRILSFDLALTSGPPILSGTFTVDGQPVDAATGGVRVDLTLSAANYSSITWAIDSPVPTSLGGAGLARFFVAPPLPYQGGLVQVTATATGAGGTTPYVFNVPIVPTVDWYLDANGVWQPYGADSLIE